MKNLKNKLNNVCTTFTVLALIFGVACKVHILETITYEQAIFTLFMMALATTLFVLIRESLLPGIEWDKTVIDITGCMAIIIFICVIKGWAILSRAYFIMIFIMVFIIYFSVWLITWWQSKKDEKELNELLQVKRKDNRK